MGQSLDLAQTYRQLYHKIFHERVLTGELKPFLVAQYLAVLWLLPTLYLAVPHLNRPWLYRARWLVLAATVLVHYDMITNVSSTNFGAAYGAGLWAAWGIVWHFTLLVWRNPQRDAKRIERRRISPKKIMRQNGKSDAQHMNGKANGGKAASNGTLRHRNGSTRGPGVEERGTKQAKYEYFWQPYPADASFWIRLNWSFDIVSTMRMTGWNWAIPCLPPYDIPPTIDGQQQPLSALPQKSRQGYTRTHSRWEFFKERMLWNMIPTYTLVDFVAVLMTEDPYFILGPENDLALPAHLAAMHPTALRVRRIALSLMGILAALNLTWNFGALCLCFLGGPLLGFRAHPFHLPTMTGPFTEVLDRGLAGFWGSWWHQTFRFGFTAPTKWLMSKGYIRKGTVFAGVIGVVIPFMLSGFLHAAASYSAVPKTKPWLPPLFFLSSGIGAIIQQWVATMMRSQIQKMPRLVRRAGNLTFVVVWLSMTSWMLVDDFCRCGLWLFEPVPVSFFRLSSLGDPADGRLWRYGGNGFFPSWHTGRHWWDSGIRL